MDPEKDWTHQKKLGMRLQVLAPEPRAWTSHFSSLGPQGSGRRMSETLQLRDGDTENVQAWEQRWGEGHPAPSGGANNHREGVILEPWR